MPKRILVTGGAGFIGHCLIASLLDETEAEIVCLDRLDTSGNLNRLAEVLEERPGTATRLKVVWHDLKAPLNESIRHTIGRIHYVLHLAAGSHVDRSIKYPLEFVMDNVVGTCNLLDYAREYLSDSLELFLYFSTDEIFGPAPEGVFYGEDDRYRAGNPYAASKAGAEELCVSFENTYRMPIIITHTMNVFGQRQHPEKFIPLVIQSVRDNIEVPIHSNPDCTQAGKRHYIHSLDVAHAVQFLIGDVARSGQKYNIVGQEELDNLQLAQMIADIMGRKLRYKMVDFHSSRPGHDLRYALSGEKMKNLGFIQHKRIGERLAEVVEWTLKNPRWLRPAPASTAKK